MFWKVLREARIDPPIQTEYLRSGGATILTCNQREVSNIIRYDNGKQTFMLADDSDVSSFCIRSAIPGNMVVPPDRTMLP
jgi:hypothetical protein